MAVQETAASIMASGPWPKYRRKMGKATGNDKQSLLREIKRQR